MGQYKSVIFFRYILTNKSSPTHRTVMVSPHPDARFAIFGQNVKGQKITLNILLDII